MPAHKMRSRRRVLKSSAVPTGAGHQLDPVERAMLQFAYRWAPYGGGLPSEIFVEFGMPAQEYFDRVRKIVDRECARGRIESNTGAVIRDVCDARLAGSSDRGTDLVRRVARSCGSESRSATASNHPVREMSRTRV